MRKTREEKAEQQKKREMMLHALRPAIPAFVIGFAASLVNILARTGFTQVIRFTVDDVLLRAVEAKALLFPVLVAVLLSVLRFAAGYVEDSHLAKGAERFVKALRDRLFRQIEQLPYSWHQDHATGDIISRCTTDVEIIRTFIADQMVELITTCFMLVIYSVFMFTMDVRLSVIAFLFIPVVLIYSMVFYGKISRRYAEADEAEAAVSAAAQENITGVRVVRAFGRERDEMKRFEEKTRFYTDKWLSIGRMLNNFWSTGDAISMLQILSVILVGVHSAVSGRITLGTYLAFVSYTRQLNWPVRALGRVITEMSKAGVSIDRVYMIMDAKPEEEKAGKLTANMHGDIAFEHVTFAYDKTPVLQDVSFTIPGGSTLGILGETGSGKSTIALLLSRLYDPDQGRITIDGVDIREMPLHALRENISIVLQEPFLFSRTVAENIAMTKPDASREEIERVAEEACLNASVEGFHDGYDTVVGERGVTLSGGQKQRTAIARSLLQQPAIMVFDDALSAVDAKTDAAIREKMREAAGSATLVLIAHRVSTLMKADHILVLEQGRLVEEGTHESLMAEDGQYARVARMQRGDEDNVG